MLHHPKSDHDNHHIQKVDIAIEKETFYGKLQWKTVEDQMRARILDLSTIKWNAQYTPIDSGVPTWAATPNTHHDNQKEEACVLEKDGVPSNSLERRGVLTSQAAAHIWAVVGSDSPSGALL